MSLESYANAPLISSPSTAWTTLNGAIDASVTTVTVASASAFPSSGQYRIAIGDELLLVTAGAGTTSWTVTRGVESTTAASHANGASVYGVLTAASLLRNPGSLTATGDVPYLASTGAPTRLAAGADGTYLRYASSLPTASALLMSDLSGSSIVYGTDTTFARGSAAGQMTLSAGATSPSLRLKNGSAAELGCIYWDSNNWVMGTQGGVGAGTVRDSILSSAANLILATQGTSRWTLDAATAHLRPWATATYDLGTASYVVRSAYVSKLGTLTTNGFVTTSGSDGTLGIDTSTYITSSVTTLSSLASIGTITTGVWHGTVIDGQYGGTGVANTSKTITLGGNLTTSGAFATTLTVTNTTSVTLPTTGTLATLAGSETLTNKTLNGNTFTAGTYTLTGAASKVLTFNNTLTLAGTDSTTMTFPSTSATIARLDAAQTFTVNGALSTPGETFNGTWITGGTATTTKPYILIEVTGATSAAWNTSGTGLGINAASGFSGNLFDGQVNGASKFAVDRFGQVTAGGTIANSSSANSALLAAGVQAASNTLIGFSSTTNATGTADAFLNRGGAAATIQMGVNVNGAPVNQTFKAHNGITGTDVSSASLTIASGVGTGAGAVSQVLIQTPTALGSGTTAQSLTTRVTIDVNGLKATGYLSSDGSAGVSAGPYTTITSLTVKNGLITAISGA